MVSWLFSMLAVDGYLFVQSLGTVSAVVVVVSVLRARDRSASRKILWRKAFHLLVVVLFVPVCFFLLPNLWCSECYCRTGMS